jgi:acyl-CoA synthetase (AMP-forming)/AMP-acid ligase II
VRFLLDAFDRHGERTAIVWRERAFSYAWLAEQIDRLGALLEERSDTGRGTAVALRADHSPRSIALLLALLERGCIVAPISAGFDEQREALLRVAEVKTEIAVDDADEPSFAEVGHEIRHPLLAGLSRAGTCGLVLFSSGSAGRIKGVVHDGTKLLEKYRTPRRPLITIPFMLFDHIGGINTLLHTLSSGGTAVTVRDRSPEAVCRLIEKHRVQALPATPTFLNLLLLSEHASYDLSSLEILAYGAERMPEATLARLRAAFPNAKLTQSYGMSELGILHTKSEGSDSLWMKIGGDGVSVRVRDGLLEVRAETAMIGYLDEESPFTEDGWLRTGDRVEVRGEWMRVLGRESDLIIIGGEKVYPAEVEDLIASMPGVVDVAVTGEANAITGQIVKAEVQLSSDESRADFRVRMTDFLAGKLAPFKIPQKVIAGRGPLQGARLKKRRF